MINGSQFNCTVILFDGIDDKIQQINNLKLNINALIGTFDNDTVITKTYELYFTIFPPINIYVTNIQQLKKNNPNNYLYIIKSGKRYYALNEKFKFFNIQFDSFIDIFDTDEIIINKLDKNNFSLLVEI